MPDVLPFPAFAANSASHSSARWLARRVLAKDVAGVLAAVPAPRLVSDHLKGSSCLVRDYVRRWATRPDAGSSFAARTRWLRWLPGAFLTRLLAWRGYDGYVYPLAERISGHIFFQRRGAATHAFSVAVDDEFDGKGFSVVMMLDYLAHASQLRGVVKARVGTGGNNVTRRLLQRLKRHEASLGWQVGEDGWVTFSPALENAQLAIVRHAA